MDLFTKNKAPLNLVHFTQPWSQKFQNFDIFFDSFSNSLIFFREGFFIIWDQADKAYNQGRVPFTLNLATIYKQILACCIHPEKTCLSFQVSENSLILLFLKERAAEEIKLTFSKAKMIHAFSFVFGDDFNFFVATNISIDLYKIKLDKQKAKLMKNIAIQISDPQFYYEPMANTMVVTDSKGTCHPFFLNLYKQKQHRGKPFQLETSNTNLPAQSTDLSRLQSQNTGEALNHTISSRASFSERALAYFKKGNTPKFQLATNIYNKNIKAFIQKNLADPDAELLGHSHVKRTQHQIMVSTLYNKVIMTHYNPYTNQVVLFELDPAFNYKFTNPINVTPGALIQLQVVDHLLVIHNMDDQVTQLFDIKLQDYEKPLLVQNSQVQIKPASNVTFLSDLMLRDEKSVEEEHLFKGFLSPEFNQILDGGEQDVTQTKEYIEMNLKINYTSDEDKPIKAEVDIPVDENSALKSSSNEDESKESDLSQPPAIPSYSIYDDSLIFIDPMFIIDLKNFSCLSLHFSLSRFIKSVPDNLRLVMSLLNRSHNKHKLLKHLKHLFIHRKLSVIEISKFFMKMNSVYKQASIERQQIKKRATKDSKPIIDNPLLHGRNMELLLLQQQRLCRLRANTTLTSTQLNNLLMEFSPSNRVLSGESIIFQNEMLDIFKAIIQNSTHPIDPIVESADRSEKLLPPRYIVSVMLEFLRTLLENNIPQQPSQQHLLIKFILLTKDYQTMHSLLQYHVLNDSLDLARTLITIGCTPPQKTDQSSVPEIAYEPAFQLGLDMLKKLKSYDEIVNALLGENLVLKALDFAQEYAVHSLKLSNFLACVERLKNDGFSFKADLVLKRITEIKKYDEAKMKNEREYKPILVEE